MHKQGDLQHRSGLSSVAEAKRGQALRGHQEPCIAGCARRQGEFHLFLGVGEAVLPAPRSDASVLAAPFVPLIEVEVEGRSCWVLPSEEVHGKRFCIPSSKIAHVAVRRKHGDDANLHADRALIGRWGERKGDVRPSCIGMEASLNLTAHDIPVKPGVVERCIGQNPRRGQRGVDIHSQHPNPGDVGGVGHRPTTGQRVGDERLSVSAVAGDGVDFRHACRTAFEFEVKAELVDQAVVEQVDGDHEFVGSLHPGNDLTGGVEDGPVEVGAVWNVGLDGQGCVGIVGEKLGGTGLVPEGWAGPVGLGWGGDVDVVNEPIVATGAAAAGLMDAELRIGVKRCCGQCGHELEVARLSAPAAESLEHGPGAGCSLVLELKVFTAVRRFAATGPPLVDPCVERNVRAASEVHHRRSPVG